MANNWKQLEPRFTPIGIQLEGFQVRKQKFNSDKKSSLLFMDLSKYFYDTHCTKNKVFHEEFLQYMWSNSQETRDLVTFTGETLNRKHHFLCSDNSEIQLR